MAKADAAKGVGKARVVEKVVERVVSTEDDEALEREKLRIKEVIFLDHTMTWLLRHHFNTLPAFSRVVFCVLKLEDIN